MNNTIISGDASLQGSGKSKGLDGCGKKLTLSLIVALGVFVVLSVVFIALYCVEKANSTGIKYSYAGKDAFIIDNSYEEKGGAAREGAGENIKNSPYFPSYDFYNGVKPTDTLVLLDHFKTLQQATDYTCGGVSTLMVLHYYGVTDVTERGLEEEMDIRDQVPREEDGAVGASTASIVKAFTDREFEVISSKDPLKEGQEVRFEDELAFGEFVEEQLKMGRPIIVESLMWDGHWTVIIGIDRMGKKDNSASHVLIMADPWDTTDHNQDGYYVVSLDRFFAIWKDYELMPKEERSQQFVIPYRMEEQ